jgi:two-component system chemotaxis response regulator CheY
MSLNFEKLSILVVEDTQPMQKLLVSVLNALGIQKVQACSNGEDGFRAFCMKQHDIILCDWQMEPVDGIGLTELVRKNPASPNKMTPIILITGYSAMSRVTKARDAGVTEFLVKPFTANDVAKRLAYVINKPRDFVQTQDFFGPDRRRRSDPDFKGPYRRQADLAADIAFQSSSPQKGK